MVVAREGLLLPAPFAEFLEAEGEARGWCALAEQLDVDEARVRRLSKCANAPGRDTGLVTAVLVDTWTTKLGGKRIAELYGPLYDMSIGENGQPGGPPRDWCGLSCKRCGNHLREPAQLCGFCIEES